VGHRRRRQFACRLSLRALTMRQLRTFTSSVAMQKYTDVGCLQYRPGGQGRGRGACPQAAYRHHMRSGVAVVLIAVAVTAMAACSPAGQSAPPLPSRPPAIALPGGSAAPVSAAGCLARRTGGPLPVWARSGFHPPSMPIGHVMGLRGDIVAILWGGPESSLYAPPLPDVGNKVLWVSRLADKPGAPLRVRAMLNGTHRTAALELPDVGPSYVNLPAPGCWTLDLSWSGHRDQVELWYTAT
jgi:hypothetical protein